jgi:hypothetical protein
MKKHSLTIEFAFRGRKKLTTAELLMGVMTMGRMETLEEMQPPRLLETKVHRGWLQKVIFRERG